MLQSLLHESRLRPPSQGRLVKHSPLLQSSRVHLPDARRLPRVPLASQGSRSWTFARFGRTCVEQVRPPAMHGCPFCEWRDGRMTVVWYAGAKWD